MIRKDKVFANLFSSAAVIPSRLAAFGDYVKEAFSKLPDSATYSDIIEAIAAALEAMSKEGDDVNVNLIEQKEDTVEVKTFITGFVQYMRENEMAIGGALGGKQSAGYKAFYPYGLTEYINITHAGMKELTLRVQTVTTKWGGKLPAQMQAALKAFSPDWEKVRGKQQGQIATVGLDRKSHSSAYTDLQLVLTKAVHKVAFENPGDEALGNKLFPFHMLYAPARNRKLVLEGTLATGETVCIMNRTLTPRVSFLVRNTEVNSNICLWLSPVANSTAPVKAVVVKAGETKKISASKLGDLVNGSFLMVMNMSSANVAGYEITVSGLPKDKKEKEEKKVAAATESAPNPEVALPETMITPESEKEKREMPVELYQ